MKLIATKDGLFEAQEKSLTGRQIREALARVIQMPGVNRSAARTLKQLNVELDFHSPLIERLEASSTIPGEGQVKPDPDAAAASVVQQDDKKHV